MLKSKVFIEPFMIFMTVAMYCCRSLFLIGFFTSQAVYLLAQTTVGMGTDTPTSHAVLELSATQGNQGFLAPRLTKSQRTASSFIQQLTSAENGLLVFDTDEGQFFYWYNGEWKTGTTATAEGTPRSTVWYTGIGAPSNTRGADGDFYINETTAEVYQRKDGSFVLMGSLSPAEQQWTTSASAPEDAANTIPGSFHLNSNTRQIWVRDEDNAWKQIGRLVAPSEEDGPVTYQGTTAPRNEQGKIGDFYIQVRDEPSDYDENEQDRDLYIKLQNSGERQWARLLFFFDEN